MRAFARSVLMGVIVCAAPGIVVAQNPPADPRVGLKPGLHDAGEAAWNMERVTTLAKPDGFFDPNQPAGPPTPPERPATPGGRGAAAPDGAAQTGQGAAPDGAAQSGQSAAPDGAAQSGQSAGPEGGAPGGSAAPTDAAAAGDGPPAAGPQTPDAEAAAREREAAANRLGFATSDIAFAGNLMFVGTYHGFHIYDIEIPRQPRLVSSVVCPGGQGDISVRGNLLIMSVEQTRGRLDCGVQGVQGAVSAERFRGVRIFDIGDLTKPRQVAAVQTCRGSHTHTLVVDPDDQQHIYIYGSGTAVVRSGDELAGCSGKDPKEDPNTSLFSIDVIQVPLAAPERARIVNQPRIFADAATGAISGLWQGGNQGPGTQTARVTNQCHDITVFPELGLAAGACSGNGILLDIRDPINPVRLDAVVDKGFSYWHSATFSNDGTRVVFTDEWGGGTRPRCRASDPQTWGANAVFEVVDFKLQFKSYYKLPAVQSEVENCVAHNGSLVPVPGRDIMVQAWYQGGISVFDFTDPGAPVEIAFFDRGPVDATQLVTAGFWSAYWHNGYIYGTEIARGVDVFRLTPSAFLTRNEIDAATEVQTAEFNPQQQKRITWPASSVVARAYVDQLTRSRAMAPPRATAIGDALTRIDELRSRRDRGASNAVDRLNALARQVDDDARSASGADADRLRALAATLRGRASGLR